MLETFEEQDGQKLSSAELEEVMLLAGGDGGDGRASADAVMEAMMLPREKRKKQVSEMKTASGRGGSATLTGQVSGRI
jgi:hypothetical protein